MTVWSCWLSGVFGAVNPSDKHPTIFSENPHLQILSEWPGEFARPMIAGRKVPTIERDFLRRRWY